MAHGTGTMRTTTLTHLWMAGLSAGILLLMLGWFAVARAELPGDRGGLTALINKVEAAALTENWTEAGPAMVHLEERWRAKRFWMQLNNGERSVVDLDIALSQMNGGIQAGDKSVVVASANAARNLIKAVVSVVPGV